MQPLIYTAKGNLPIADLSYSTCWERTEDYVKFVETYKLGEEVVKESAHILALKPLSIEAIAGENHA